MTPKAQYQQKKKDKLDFIKTKFFCAKESEEINRAGKTLEIVSLIRVWCQNI